MRKLHIRGEYYTPSQGAQKAGWIH